MMPWCSCAKVPINDRNWLISPIPVECDFNLEPLRNLVSVSDLKTLVSASEMKRMFLDDTMGDVQVCWLNAEVLQDKPAPLEEVCTWLEKAFQISGA
eukprot:426617-Karenia_brevis.AAC.1